MDSDEQRFQGMPLVDAIVEYESGNMDCATAREFLQWLHDQGILNHLQGAYQRAYNDLCT